MAWMTRFALGAMTAMVLALAVAAAGPAAGSVRGHANGQAGLARVTATRTGTPDSPRLPAGRQLVPGFPFRSILPARIGLNRISCVSGSWCVAVGSYTDPLEHSRSLAEVWNGSKWRILPGAGGSGLSAVSCASTRFCMALGSPAQRWDGRRWTAVPTPRRLHLAGISCLRASFCMAVGWGLSRNGFDCESAAAWNGTRWHAFPILNPCAVEARGLTSVSCASASMCMAVGDTLESDNKTDLTLAEAWDGKKWQVLATPAPGFENGLSTVSCPTRSFCLAVGFMSPEVNPPCGTTTCNLALTWNGSTWQQVDTPGDSGLSAVSCASAASCVAVSGSQALSWDGTTWTQLTLAQPGTAGMALPSIACWSGTGCLAVGAYGTLDGASLPLAEQWNGSTWQVRRTPGPGDAFSGLSGVSCASTTRCMAVGNRINSSDVQVTLAERWDGRRWRALATPNPGAQLNVLTAVSCPAAADCMAVGYYYDSAGDRQALAEQWNGASWQVLTVPHDGLLRAVSCPQADHCMAVGDYLNGKRQVTLSATWDGANWTVQASPDLGGPLTEFFGVSCTSGSNCIAVGDHTVRGSPLRPLAARWDGTAWTVQNTPVLRGASGLTSVSCPRPASCTATGSHFRHVISLIRGIHYFPTRTLAETWNGSHWQVRATPAISAQLRPFLTAVSCGTPTQCIAVGGFLSPSAKALVLAETWNGTAWQRLAIPSPDPAFNYLYTVACPAAARCVAAGEQGVQRTSAYRWNGASWQPLPNP